MTPVARLLTRPRNVFATLALAVVVVVAIFAATSRGSAPDLPTVPVAKGEFVDTVEIRGEIRPLKSVVLSSPLQSGELQIVKLAKSGTMVKPGDVVVEFDSTTLRRIIQERQSELRQADAEIEQTMAQARITSEQNATALMKAKYDIERAKLDVARGDVVPRIQIEQAKLVVGETEQRLRELEARMKSDSTGAEADLAARRRRRQKVIFDLERAQRGLEALRLEAPSAGMVNVLPNPRSGGPFGGEQEFREGDRAWPGAAILELPDLSAVRLEARLDESDRGRLKAGQEATVRLEAIPGKDFKATVDRISVLARVDFGGGFPPPRNFDLVLLLKEVDARLRPGMTAVARIAAERTPDVVLVPTEAIFQRNGLPVVYLLDGSEFEERQIEVSRRGKEQAIVTRGVAPGDRVAARRPGPELIRRAP